MKRRKQMVQVNLKIVSDRNPLGALLSRSRRARQREEVVQDYSARPETVKVKTVVVFGAGAVSTTPSALMLL